MYTRAQCVPTTTTIIIAITIIIRPTTRTHSLHTQAHTAHTQRNTTHSHSNHFMLCWEKHQTASAVVSAAVVAAFAAVWPLLLWLLLLLSSSTSFSHLMLFIFSTGPAQPATNARSLRHQANVCILCNAGGHDIILYRDCCCCCCCVVHITYNHFRSGGCVNAMLRPRRRRRRLCVHAYAPRYIAPICARSQASRDCPSCCDFMRLHKPSSSWVLVARCCVLG